MGRRLIVDTNILIDIERTPGAPPEGLRDDDELAIAAVTAAELLVGVQLASSPELAAARRAKVERILTSVEVLDYTRITASLHSELLAHTRRMGTPRGAHDLIIAAHAREQGRELLTRDGAARFADLPGVRVASS